MRVRFRPQARAEIREARSWFEGRVAGLGRAFISEVETTINLLRVYPQIYGSVSEDEAVRRAFLHRFPYSLVYEILTEHDIVVLACRHVRQDELDWNVAHRDV